MQEARRLVSRVACAQSNLNASVAQTHTSSNMEVFKSHFSNGFLALKCPSGSFYTSKNILPQLWVSIRSFPERTMHKKEMRQLPFFFALLGNMKVWAFKWQNTHTHTPTHVWGDLMGLDSYNDLQILWYWKCGIFHQQSLVVGYLTIITYILIHYSWHGRIISYTIK